MQLTAATRETELLEEDHKMDDLSLVARAREGDQTAFYELVRRHRSKACSIARSLMKDDHLAEDIVQDALLRAFLKLGTLVDDNRFLPWFHRIVRTQAWMKLRRGGWYRRETPFSELSVLMKDTESKFGQGDDVDRILFHLQERSAARAKYHRDPAEDIVRKETLDAIVEMLGCLRRKERAIFEAYFFEELTPKEIAALFATTPANVYNSISRTKAKLQKERLRIYVNGYVEQRRKRGLLVRKILDSSKIHF